VTGQGLDCGFVILSKHFTNLSFDCLLLNWLSKINVVDVLKEVGKSTYEKHSASFLVPGKH
jgi:hypothetical protein